ncbi:MAG: hypothetical protein WAU89_01550 [Candidatus Acidiferrales bacterium]
MDNQFLVAARIGRYLTRLIGQSPITTQVPSTALHVGYAAADRMVQRLKDAGFPEAHVCTLRGLPATPQDIFDAEHAQDAGAIEAGQ